MENASKALIIAGAILLSIMIIGLGIMIFTNARDQVGSSNLNKEKIDAINSTYLQYEGTNISVNTKRATCWSNLCAKNVGSNIRIPSDILSSDENFEMTPAMIRMTEIANSYDYETWHDINIWGKETGLISPRDTAFMGSIYYWCKRGKELTYKQARYAMKVLELARSKGWEE